MDWIKLTKSGKDLAGTGGRILQVTPKELAKHNSRKDCWMALNGIVYNVTSYMDFHPGKGSFKNFVDRILDLPPLLDKTRSFTL